MPVGVTPVAGTTHDITIGSLGCLIKSKRRFDASVLSPRVATPGQSRFSDFSLQQTWELSSWHHGRGALEWEDPFSFYDSRGVDTRIRGQFILAPLQNQTLKTGSIALAGNPTKLALASTTGTLYLCMGGGSRDVFTWNNSTGLWNVTTAGLTSDPVDMCEFLGYVWVAQGEATTMRRRLLSSGTWSDATSAPANFIIAGAVGTSAGSALWRADNTNELYWTVDGTNWQGPLYAGDTNTLIRSLLIWDNRLYVGKDDGLYVVQEGRVNQLLDFSFARDPNNFRWMRVWQGSIYFPILNGVYRLVGGYTLQAIGPNRGAAGFIELNNLTLNELHDTFKGLASGRTGQIVDLCPTENFLYAAVDAGSGTSVILAYNGSGWHTIVEGAAANNSIDTLFFTSSLATSGQLLNPRLWYSYGASDCYNVILPFGTDDPYEYASETYADGGSGVYIDSPFFDAGVADVWKEWQEVIVISENLSSTETLQVAYELDDLGAFTNLSNPDSADANYLFTFSPYQRIAFPARSISKRIRLRLLPDRGNTNTETPKIKKVIVKYMVRPNTRYAWQITMRTGRKMRNPYLNLAEAADPTEWLLRLQQARDARFRLPFDDGDLEPGITNLVLNPQFRLDSDGDGLADNWNETGTPTTTLNLNHKIYGLRSQLTVTDSAGTDGIQSDAITVVSGTRYTASGYIYHVSGDVITFDDSAGYGTAVKISPNSDFQRFEFTFVATGTSTRIRLQRLTGDAAAATTFYLSAVQLEVTANDRFSNYELRASAYCDGEQGGCRWTGAPHASTSIRDATVQVFVSNVGATEVLTPSIGDRLRGVGDETLIQFSCVQVSA